MVAITYTGGIDARDGMEIVSPPTKLNRVLNSVSSVLTVENRLTIGQNDAKIKIK
jgi:hypothetical protein